MKKVPLLGLSVATIVLGLTLLPISQYQVDGAMEDKMEDKMMDKMEDKMMDKMMKEPISLTGDLTAPEDDKPFGGDPVGNYKLRVRDHNKVTIIAKVTKTMMEEKMMEDKEEMMEKSNVLEGWLVDMQSGYKLSTGQLGAGHTLVFTQRMVNPLIYDLIVITEEPMDDMDPNPHMPVGGAQLSEPFGQ